MAIHIQLIAKVTRKKVLHGLGIVRRMTTRKGINEYRMQVLSSNIGPFMMVLIGDCCREEGFDSMEFLLARES